MTIKTIKNNLIQTQNHHQTVRIQSQNHLYTGRVKNIESNLVIFQTKKSQYKFDLNTIDNYKIIK